jgi:small subunit ribosomal protein S4
MSKYRGPRLRVIRRLFSPQMPHQFDQFSGSILEKRRYPTLFDKKKLSRPGQHGAKKTKNPTQFAIRLKEKQKLRTYYAISEKQLIRYMKEARKIKEPTGKVLIQLLEQRLDVLLYRCTNMNTILEARQCLNHCHSFFHTEEKLRVRTHKAMSIGLNIDRHSSMNTRVTEYPRDINPRLVVEYYSNRL